MAQIKPLLKSEIEAAIRATKSNAEAARYLRCSYSRYKKYALLYGLWDSHLNESGKGIKKIRKQPSQYSYPLKDLLEGKNPKYDLGMFKKRLLNSGIFKLECAMCGYSKTRPNGVPPLLIWFRDNDRTNFKLENIELRCFNCMYLTQGLMKYPSQQDLFGVKTIEDKDMNLSSEDIEALRQELSTTKTALE